MVFRYAVCYSLPYYSRLRIVFQRFIVQSETPAQNGVHKETRDAYCRHFAIARKNTFSSLESPSPLFRFASSSRTQAKTRGQVVRPSSRQSYDQAGEENISLRDWPGKVGEILLHQLHGGQIGGRTRAGTEGRRLLSGLAVGIADGRSTALRYRPQRTRILVEKKKTVSIPKGPVGQKEAVRSCVISRVIYRYLFSNVFFFFEDQMAMFLFCQRWRCRRKHLVANFVLDANETNV